MAESFYRADARAKVSGRATYGVDLAAPGMLVGGLVRAGVPSGIVRRVDVSEAVAMPGVVILTAEDLPVPRYGMVINDQPPLAGDRVRFSREAVVAVAAPDEGTLVAAMAAVQLEIESLPYVTDVEQALDADAHAVHGDRQPYEANFPDVPQEANICGRTVVVSGDVDQAFAHAAHVVEGRYSTPRVHQGYIEPRACLAEAEPDGGFHVTTSTQNPFGVRGTLARILGVPESSVRVTGSVIGGGFGGKLDVTFEHYACLLAKKSGRPVKFISSRAEEFVAANPREDSVVHIRSALDQDGTIIGREVKCLLNAGAYAHDTPFIGAVASLQATGPYRVPNVRSEALSVYTNTQPTGAYRGPSGPQMVLAVESHMEEIADHLGIDSVELRRRHLFVEGDRAFNGQQVEDVSIGECLDRAVDAIGYGRALPPGHGIGVACAWWTTTYGPTGATVRIENDGAVSVITGATEIGSGAVAAGVVQLAAEAFGIEPAQVRLASTSDTAIGAFDFGAQGSRTTFNVGNALMKASDDVRRQLLEEGSHLLEASTADLELVAGRVQVVGAPDRSASIGDVAASALHRSGPVHASARFQGPPTPHDSACVGPHHFYPTFNSPSFHCHAVEVAVDEQTGKVEIVRYVAVQDVGRAIVPPAIEGQVQGGVLQAIGLALYEEQTLDAGHVSNASFESYKIPTAVEAPWIDVIIVEKPSTVGPGGAKGVGEPPIIVPAAAIANAVSAATGHRFRDLPLTPARVLGIDE